jgi:hypothetical protein
MMTTNNNKNKEEGMSSVAGGQPWKRDHPTATAPVVKATMSDHQGSSTTKEVLL